MVTGFKDYEKALGERLREVREQFKLTQGATARIFKITRATLNRYENAARVPTAEFIYEFASHFRIRPEWIISGTGEMHDMPRTGSFQLGTPLGIIPTPVELDIKEIVEAVSKDSKIREMVLGFVRVSRKKL